MSTFVEIAPDEYDPAAFKDFEPSAAGFKIANARAMMWLSQLAYETHRVPTIEAVSRVWDFKSVVSFIKHKTNLKGGFETCGLIGERAGAVLLAFAGSGRPRRPPVDSAESSGGMTSGFRGGPRGAPVATNAPIVHNIPRGGFTGPLLSGRGIV